MRTLVTRSLIAHRSRLVLTLLAVTLSVSFVSASFILADTLRAVFGELSTDIYDGVDAEVRTGTGDFDQLESGERFPQTSLEALADVDGIDELVPTLGGRNALFVLDDDGETMRPPGPPVLTFSTTEESQTSAFTTESGRAPASGEIMLDRVQAKELAADLGDPITIAGPGGTEVFTLSGTVSFGNVESGVIPYFLLFDLPTMQRLLDAPGLVDSAAITVDAGADLDRVLAEAQAALPDSLILVEQAELAEEQNREFGQVIDLIQTALLVFAGVTLFVSTFVIANTFAVLVGQQRREHGLLQAIGATGRQTMFLVVAEAGLVGLVASGIGLGGGVLIAEGIKTLFEAVTTGGFPEGPTRILPRTILLALGVGVGVTTVSAIVPARRASRVAPLEAMRTSAVSGVENSPLAKVLGGFAQAVVGRFGVAGRLAAGGVTRNPRRTLATAMSMIVGFGLISAMTILAASYRATISDSVTSGFDADLIVTGEDEERIPYAAISRLSALAEVEAASGFGTTEARYESDVIPIAGFQSAAADGVLVLDATAGSTGPLALDEGIVTDELAADRGLDVGDSIPLAFSDGTLVDIELRAIVDSPSLIEAEVIVDESLIAAHARNVDAEFGAIRLAADADRERGTAAVRSVLDDYPQIELSTVAEQVASREEQARQLLTLANGLLALTVIVALTGIANTVALTALERRSEFGLLRAVGMTTRQVRTMVCEEAMVVSLVGVTTGLVSGAALALVATPLLPEEFVARIDIPLVSLATYLAVGIVLGVLAALLPARRAARLDILTALEAT